MLSINIPVYNVEVGFLVSQLSEQALKLEIEHEIRVYDDCSEDRIKIENRKIKDVSHVTYIELPENLGRAAIRNKMGRDSKYKFLLFIDADSKLVSENYLSHYLRYAESAPVVCGGTSYSAQKPADFRKLLRWVYGTKREAIPAQQKNSDKGFIITSNNFMIEKKLFEYTHFRKDLTQYGHEDTLLGYDLWQKGIEIIHIDNPVEHTGLENSMVFLTKTKVALDNLYLISEILVKNDDVFCGRVKFLNKYSKIIKVVPESLLRFLFLYFHGFMEKNLTSKRPSLFIFDMYKLCYFSTIKNRRK